ncbi:MAG: hypothetical protein Q4G50_07760 [Corynebacterium sp.]|uniref:hypothetical protein n=1 Tax=Corynebacterium sp. TaxID=1720 RepID=UPI0026DF1E38|nr:hypothetical protein [Corynebacterium sp.]MDO5669885.1 hypothetical protein [Corynebacterium sp.]
MSTSQGRLDQIAEDIARAGTVDDVIAALIRECDLSPAEAHRLVGVQADHLSTELFPAGALPTGEVYDQQRYENWLTRELRTTFAAAVEKVSEDVAGFLKVVFGRGDEPTAEFNAAIFLGAKKRVAQDVSSVPVGYFCRDGLAHLSQYGAQWHSQSFTSPGWSRVGTYEVHRDDEGL